MHKGTCVISEVAKRLVGECLGTALLLAVVIGSGIMGDRLAGGNQAIVLLANSLATAGGLFVLVEVFAPLSGAHFNPAVSLVMAQRKQLEWRLVPAYVVAQLVGALLGAFLANAMFDTPPWQLSSKARGGFGQLLAEAAATFGLVLVVLRAPTGRLSAMVAAYIGAAYWFTSSTSFANPAAAFGRMFSDSFAGISPRSVGGFVMAELLGASIALVLHAGLSCRQSPPSSPVAEISQPVA